MKKLISKAIYSYINTGVQHFFCNGVEIKKDKDCSFICSKGRQINTYIPKENDTVKTVANALAKIIEEIQ